MARIYRKTDRIKVKIDDIVVTIAPLSIDQKTEVQTIMGRGHLKAEVGLLTKAVCLAMKYGIKDIEGLQTEDGTPYKLEFENDTVKDACLDDLFNLEMHEKLVLICSTLINSIPKQFTDRDGKPLEGVEIIRSATKEPADPN
jgi:hypothetical protein